MKNIISAFLIIGVIFQSSAQNKQPTGGNNGAALAGVGLGIGAIATAIYFEQQMREMVEQSAMEWALSNKKIENGDIIEMKLIEWEVKSYTDISSTSNLLFKYRRNDNAYEVIMFILSSGWWNENGIVFTRINPISIDVELWTDILYTLTTTASKDTSLVVYSQDSLLLKYSSEISRRGSDGTVYTKDVDMAYNTNFKSLEKIKGRTLIFEDSENNDINIDLVKIKGDEHIIGFLSDDGLLLDYNEKRIHLYNKETKDLIKLNLGVVNEVHRLLMRETFWFDAI
jgi:hypothetical protein